MSIDSRKISAKHYYDYLPPLRHQCGDIWANLPTFGLLGKDFVSGLIVTPACDLSNTKTETVTYLPIISVLEYFSTRAQVPILKRKIIGNYSSTQFPSKLDWGAYEFSPPNIDKIDEEIASISNYLIAKQRSVSDINSLNRASSALKLLRAASSGILIEPDSKDLSTAFGGEIDKILSRIVTNAFSTDLHFLPADGQPSEYSGILKHSVALFRYPLTVPIEILDIAAESSNHTWRQAKSERQRDIPSIKHYSENPPVKMLSLSSGFLSDLLSRYVNVFNRIGSPDFTPSTISQIIAEVKS